MIKISAIIIIIIMKFPINSSIMQKHIRSVNVHVSSISTLPYIAILKIGTVTEILACYTPHGVF